MAFFSQVLKNNKWEYFSFNGEAAASSALFRIYPEVPFQNKRNHFKNKCIKKNNRALIG